MSKNIDRKRDYYEGDLGDEQEERVELGAMELAEMIEQKIALSPDGRPKYWKRETNKLIDEYNLRFGHTFKRV